MKAAPKSRVLDKGLWGMSAPMFLDQAVTYTIPLVDMYFLSRVSDSAAAAVGAVTPLVFVANAFLQVSAFAGASIAGQRIGANDYQRGNATIGAYSLFVVVLSLIAIVGVNYGGAVVTRAMNLSDAVEGYAVEYLSIIGWMVGFWGFRLIYQTILNIYGAPKWNSFSNIIFFTVNVFGNMVAVYGFQAIPPTGVTGVALASVFAAFCSLLFVATAVHFKLRIHIPFKASCAQFGVLMMPVLLIAAPAILEPMSFQGYMMVLNWIAAGVSDLALKVKIYTYNTFLFCLMISIALSMATEAIIAQRVGRKEFDLAHLQLKQSLTMSIIGTTILAGLWLVFNQPILRLFTDDQDIISIGFWVFLLGFLAEPMRTTNIVIGGALRCAGDAAFTSVSSIAVIWLFSVPLAYVLAVPLHLGIFGLLIAAVVDEGLRALIKYFRWKARKWQHYGVIHKESIH
jgi:putative MATE family efflux protein